MQCDMQNIQIYFDAPKELFHPPPQSGNSFSMTPPKNSVDLEHRYIRGQFPVNNHYNLANKL